MIKKNKIPTILGIIILVVGVFAGVFYLNMRQIFKIGASATSQPKDIRTSNISNNSATISWTTDSETTGFLSWGSSPGSLSRIENESAGEEKYYTHSINLTGLEPETTYYYKINSEGELYDNDSVPWEFSTGPDIGTSNTSLFISGSAITTSGQPAARSIVYLVVNGYVASTLTSSTGTYLYQLGIIRTPDLTSFTQIDPASTLIEISVIGGLDGVSSAQIFPQSASPVPPIVLGNTYDFRSLPVSSGDQNPNAELSLPQDATEESKFDISGQTEGEPTKTVILESLDDGEIITSTQPEFFGKGPSGETITIEVESEEVYTEDVTIPNNGSWSWEVPSNLTPGAHTITISWKDTSGVTRFLKRNFVVQASELPAFEATPSQTLAPSASPSSTPKATATPKSTATASAAPIPQTGVSTSTFLLSIIGFAITLYSFIVWKHAQSI